MLGVCMHGAGEREGKKELEAELVNLKWSVYDLCFNKYHASS